MVGTANDWENGIIAAAAIGIMLSAGELGLNDIVQSHPGIALAIFVLLIVFANKLGRKIA